MAGSYPDPPGKRIEYERDGSGVVSWDGAALTTLTLAQAQSIARDDNAFGQLLPNFDGAFIGVVFPVPHELTGYYYFATNAACNIQHSTNTTSGLDGTWTTLFTGSASTNATLSIRHTVAASLSALRGVRLRRGGSAATLRTLHLYGHPSTAGDRLELWHPTLDQALYVTPAFNDVGDKARGSGYQGFAFRVKNRSTTLTATTITLSRDILPDATPSNLTRTELRYNAGSWGTTAAVGTLAPGGISALCDVRLNVDAATAPGLTQPRVIATAASWT